MMFDSADLPPIKPVWQDSLSTIYQGDALLTLMSMPDNIATLCITDPPYSSGGVSAAERAGKTCREKYQHGSDQKKYPEFAGDTRDQRSFICWSSLWMNELRRIVTDGGILGVFSDWRQLPATTDALQAGGWIWRGIVPWCKPGIRPQQGRWACSCEYLVWGTNGARALTGSAYPGFYVLSNSGGGKIHMTEKPLRLMYDLLAIANHDDNPCLIDPFLGSASSMLAARRRNIRSIGIEIMPEICDMAVNRMLTDTDMLGDHYAPGEPADPICPSHKTAAVPAAIA